MNRATRLVWMLCRNTLFPMLILACMLTTFAGRCNAQTFAATLTGVVSDPAGAAVPNVQLELRNTSTNDIRRVTTGPDGSYTISDVLPGIYEISGEHEGFKKFIQKNINLSAGAHATLNVVLEVGAVQQSVEVTATAVMLDTQSADHVASLQSKVLNELPVSTRNPLNLVFAFAGTIEGPMGDREDTNTQDSSVFSMGGGRSGQSEILLDGAPATAMDWGGLIAAPTIGSVAEMQIVRNTYDPQYGKGGSGIITMVSKGGGPALHGEAYEYLRRDKLDANQWGNNRYGNPKGPFKRDQYGGNVGGPIWKSKNLFFFGSYEALRQPSTTSSGPRTVPTDLERAGDFSKTYNPDGTLAVIYNPFTTRLVTDPNNPGQTFYTRDAFDASCIGVVFPNTCAGNRIPSNLIDKVGQAAANLYPSPNQTGQGYNNLNNFFKQGSQNVNNDHLDARVDWSKSEKHRIFWRWTQRAREELMPSCYYCNGADTDWRQKEPGWHTTVNYTATPSPNWVVNVLLAASRWRENQSSAAVGVLTPADLGLDGAQFQAPIAPAFQPSGYTDLVYPKVREYLRYTHMGEGTITRQMGAHTFKFGASLELQLINNVDRFSAYFGFGRGMSSCDPGSAPGDPCVAQLDSNTTGNSIASLLMGIGGGSAPLNPDKAMSQRTYGAFFQDTWRVTPKLTLNLGVRYENQRPATERFNRLAYLNMDVTSPLAAPTGLPLKGGIEYVSSSDRFAWPAENHDFAPRIGVAYKLTNKLVARMGFGIFYTPSSSMISFDDPGQFLGYSTDTSWQSSVGGGGYIPKDLLSNPFPNGKNQPTGSGAGLMTAVGDNLSQVWPKQKHPTGYKQHFSFDVEYEVTPGSVLEVGYTGFRARKLMWGNPSLDANQLNPQFLSLGSHLDDQVPNPFYGVVDSGFLADETIARHHLLRSFPQYWGIQWARSMPGATANYNALNVKFTHQFRSGLSVLSTYQYSSLKDNASEDFLGWSLPGGQWRDYFNTRQEYSISSHDLPHSFVTSLVYELPVGKGKRFGANMPAVGQYVIGGWQVSSIIRLTSGFPIGPIGMADNSLGAYGIGGRPNLVGKAPSMTGNPDQWFTTEAFAVPADYTIGNAPRYISSMRGRGARNVDMALSKNFKFGERFGAQIRSEFLNFLNTPQYDYADTCFNCGSAGYMYGTRNYAREVQMGFRFTF